TLTICSASSAMSSTMTIRVTASCIMGCSCRRRLAPGAGGPWYRSPPALPEPCSERCLGSLARGLAYQPWHQVARQADAQGRDQFARAIVAYSEMRRAAHVIELVQVVGQHAAIEQAFGQRGQAVRGVVHAREQHRLVQQDRAG